MRIGGSGLVAADLIPSGGGVMRNQDLVSERDGVFINPFAFSNNVAARFSCVQLLNAAASGRRLLVDEIIVQGSSAASTQFRSHNVALATDVGAWVSMNPPATAGNAHVFHADLAALPGTLIVQIPKLSVVSDHFFTFNYAIMLDEDEGLVICSPTANRSITVAFIGREV